MRLHVSPLPVAANAKAYVLTVAANATKRAFMYCLLPYWVRAAPMYEFSISAGRA